MGAGIVGEFLPGKAIDAKMANGTAKALGSLVPIPKRGRGVARKDAIENNILDKGAQGVGFIFDD